MKELAMSGEPKATWRVARSATCVGLPLLLAWCVRPAGHAQTPPPAAEFHVSPAGDDDASGTAAAPFRTIRRAQTAARQAVASAAGDVVVNVGPGVYRLDRTLEFTEADSGRNGHRVVYRSGGGPGKARLLGSRLLKGWREHRDGIWQVGLPEKTVFHTLYEDGKRAHKARFPNYEHHPDFPMARGRYLLTQDGSPIPKRDAPKSKSQEPGWLIYHPDDAPPVTSGAKMKILLYGGGKCDWFRVISPVKSIDPEARRLLLNRQWRGIGVNARFFLEDAMGFLDAPGEFYVDEESHTLYYKPMGQGHPDTLGICAPVLTRLIQLRGESRDNCVANVRLEGLALEETDGRPKSWWSTGFGLRDGALIWMGNATNVEIRACHLKNSGRNGVVMAGHNIGNVVTGCWIESMGVNGVTLSNRWYDRKKGPPLGRCEYNRVHNCRIHNIGEIHTYAGCVNVFNVSHNEISHCELYDSVRYAVTVRGNTGQQYGPPVSTDHLPCSGNRMHHLRAYRCGQDGGDMGTLHCANLNNPGGGFVNTFEQITVADSRAIPSMKDIGPDGIFLDWPKMAMDQIFRNVHIIRSQDQQLRSNKPENAESAQTFNVSWKPGFKTEFMDYENIGLTAEFPAEYGGRRATFAPPPPPSGLSAEAPAHHTVVLKWRPPVHQFGDIAQYTVFRNGKAIALVTEPGFTDTRLAERTVCRYEVAAQDGDFCHSGPKSEVCEIRTPPDLTRPVVENAWSTRDGERVRVLFSKPMARPAARRGAGYRFAPELKVTRAGLVAPDCVELEVDGLAPGRGRTLTITGLTDATPARNPLEGGIGIAVAPGGKGASYPMQLTDDGRLLDCLGSGGDARLHGGAAVEEGIGPFGGAALVLDGKTGYAEASPDLNLGGGDFTLMLWLMKEGGGHTALSKGNGFGSLTEWTLGWPAQGVPGSVALRLNNVFHSTAAKSVPAKKWVHVAFVRRGNQGFTYANGEPSGGPHDLSVVGALVNDQPLRIGRRTHEPNPAYFRGKIAGVKILDHALSGAQIRAHAQGAAKRTDD